MLVSTASFQRSTAVCLGAATDANTNARQLLLRGSSFDERQLFDPRPPYDFYNDACASECQGDEDLTLFDNMCPKCPEKYASAHCNHCCYDGASSLRLRWHGCPGEVTFASVEQGVQDCELEADDRSPTDGIRFIECSCYERINTPETFDPSACQPLATKIVITSSYGIDSDICIVSVNEQDDGAAVIDLSKPLPAVLGLVHSPLSDDEEDYTSQYWNPYPLRTYFDTTCSIIDDETAPYVLPLFPGYGKIPSSCPSVGFIDLEDPETPRLPEELDHSNGEPSTEPFWYEFVDGTSTGFWPNEATDDSVKYSFDPTFATCACHDCAPTPPGAGTRAPTVDPNPGGPRPPTAEPTPVPVAPSPRPVQQTSPAPVQSQPTPAPVAPVSPPTPSPVQPTLAPVSPPTPSPVQPTVAPVSPPTPSPVQPTPSPIQPTGAPVSPPTPSPVQPTVAPVSPPTPSPVQPTVAPVSPPTPSPVQPTVAPVSPPTPSPVQPTVAPVSPPTPSPLEPTSSPVEPTSKPTQAPEAPEPTPTPAPQEAPTPTPVEPTSLPSPSPVEPTSRPTHSPVATQSPVKTTPAPSKHDCPPTPEPTSPSLSSPPPPVAEPTQAPVAPTPSPIDPTTAPTPSPAPSPPDCSNVDYAFCNSFASTKCLTSGAPGRDDGQVCGYIPTSGRKLKALESLVSSPSLLEEFAHANAWFSKSWILASKQHHQAASVSLRFA